MKKFIRVQDSAAQGELYLRRVDSIPKEVKPIKPEKDKLIVGHSETGHHHYISPLQARFFGTENPMICYLRVEGEYADLIHDRSFDKHITLRIPTGDWEIRKQREHTPEGWRAVSD